MMNGLPKNSENHGDQANADEGNTPDAHKEGQWSALRGYEVRNEQQSQLGS
jgi:hypothetical protein